MKALAQLWVGDGPSWWWAVAGLVLVFLGLRLGVWSQRRREARRAHRARKVGKEGARRSQRALRRAGYEILELEVRGWSELEVDGRRRRYAIRVDALVSRGGRRYVAEFKARERGASLRNRDTRRQLIEYALAFPDCEAVLLVEGERGRVQEVRLPAAQRLGAQRRT
ncbi:hypothetical protein G6O69_32440 [Pseudenhygromyxa sp. WMMC2535]|uniref:hypothetical protein n=1 Tax=Pseudenhygromyxa sp. WMMC2535 TaxID=2712867 RepID=UPI001556BC1F|nr:hypothetical protein [Pseudenhygromyxa sp. WMMC2535]NVB42578.1 hypothetical protein [Pseudenhygromyxa sp. WMMC2535]